MTAAADVFRVDRSTYQARSYATIGALRAGQIVDLDGLLLVADKGEIAPGDLYVAERNSGPHLLTASFLDIGAVFPTTTAYPFDSGECVKVREWS